MLDDLAEDVAGGSTLSISTSLFNRPVSNCSCANAGLGATIDCELRTAPDKRQEATEMALKIIVSYDDTDNDRDALALGRLLAFSGAELSLAYVRHSFGGALEQKEAEELLARGAASVGAPEMARHVIVNPGTSVGLTELAEREDADVIVFGSEYRTAPGTRQARASRPTNCCSAVRRRSPSRRPACAQPGLGRHQHRRRHRRGRRRRPRRPPRASPRALGASVAELRVGPGRPARRRLAPRGAGGQSRRSAPPATTRSRRRPTRCWSCRAAVPLGFTAPQARRSERRRQLALARFLTTRITAATSGSRPSILSRASLQWIARGAMAGDDLGG